MMDEDPFPKQEILLQSAHLSIACSGGGGGCSQALILDLADGDHAAVLGVPAIRVRGRLMHFRTFVIGSGQLQVWRARRVNTYLLFVGVPHGNLRERCRPNGSQQGCLRTRRS